MASTEKRMERHERSSMGEFDDYYCTTVECVELIDRVNEHDGGSDIEPE